MKRPIQRAQPAVFLIIRVSSLPPGAILRAVSGSAARDLSRVGGIPLEGLVLRYALTFGGLHLFEDESMACVKIRGTVLRIQSVTRRQRNPTYDQGGPPDAQGRFNDPEFAPRFVGIAIRGVGGFGTLIVHLGSIARRRRGRPGKRRSPPSDETLSLGCGPRRAWVRIGPGHQRSGGLYSDAAGNGLGDLGKGQAKNAILALRFDFLLIDGFAEGEFPKVLADLELNQNIGFS